jgi:hypothetical protein
MLETDIAVAPGHLEALQAGLHVHAAGVAINTIAPVNLRQDLVFWESYQQQNDHLFPTAESWKWCVRQHRAEFIEKGALCFVAGRLFVLPRLFDQSLVEIGQRLAAKRNA